ncbi:MAG: 2-succinyl-6-hydroxy-2,4-cyclohexadiene-1-carboxylate synthase [Ignavibacteriae bacterium]|nr:2-succinyl-6-hydroxy-2,4-cyclohexadiene-1-carboxylate synthase [Ignavibacteriota bacterium]NOG99971.1 2-succinyl-6-hydroxy-2,4-cyclohexadiene-1-carboxylate synthase [Ignavibacteriota bacterium]
MAIKNFEIDNISINLICNKNEWNKTETPIIFLHGFTGSAADWQFIFPQLDDSYFAAAIDLIGHGKTDSPENINFYSEDYQHKIIEAAVQYFGFDKFVLAGYSMGGRLALGYTICNPAKVAALILESTTAGIENPTEREERIYADKKLAENLIAFGINSFIESWLKLPIFSSLKNIDSKKYELMKKNKLRSNKTGLANTLLAFSTGAMRSYWNKISEINCRTLFITGELDSKFLHFNKQMNAEIRSSQLEVIKNCGHNAHLEKPNEFIILINNFLKHLKIY